ncbi:RNA polymerase subunit sigma-24 [Pedobacter yonginense]|uniref:RNA polymerase subunit sigma-24 n=1 Tax=Pedobacter yonginense TaxID=651869 RepID=A0A317ENS9_9SPHI|nr:sigma-70 family RNA polymerase sigma factor [Pedobacter yonginense]PWS28005.1 RNA polymerase subunit sigma-24 [Pedobacter yonginense]
METDKNRTAATKLYSCNPQQWVAQYADYLYGYAITRIDDEDLAKDLVQETFLSALEKVDRFEGRSSESTWLTAILKNKIIDIYRKKASGLRQLESDVSLKYDTDFFNEEDGHWNENHRPQVFGLEDYDVLGKKELRGILKLCLQKLPSLWLSVFTMKHMDDEASAAICTELNITDANFWVIMHRTKINLRSCLQKNWL